MIGRTACLLLLAVTAAVEGLDGLYFSNATDILFSSNLVQYRSVFSQPNGRIVGLAYDYDDQRLFFSDIDFSSRGIYGATVNSDGGLSDVRLIVNTDIVEVNGMSVDPDNNRLYWTDGKKKTIETCDYDGTKRLTLKIAGLNEPRGILVDPVNLWLYWNDQTNKKIERARLDGSGQELVQNSLVSLPNQMALSGSNLYWADAGQNSLMQNDLSTSTVSKRVLTDNGNAFGVALIGQKAYVSVWSGSILEVDLASSSVNPRLSNLGSEPVFSLLYYSSQTHGSSPCQTHGCSHICLPTDTSFRCACPSTGGLALFGTNCQEPNNVLLYTSADDGDVAFHVLDPGADNSYRYVVGRSLRPIAVTYDPVDKMVYWSDVMERTVHRSKLDGTQHVMFLSYNHSLGFVEGLAVDIRGRRLYYSNWGSVEQESAIYTWHKVESVSLTDPNGDRHVALSDLEKPRALTIAGSKLYVTDWGSQARVLEVGLDGSEPTVVGAGLDNPNGVTVLGNNVYVIDSHYKTRKSENVNYPIPEKDASLYVFKKQSTTWTSRGFDLDQDIPFGIGGEVVNGDHRLYISYWDDNSVRAADYSPSTDTLTMSNSILTSAQSPMGVFRTSLQDMSLTSPCGGSTCDDNQVCLVDDTSSATCQCNSYRGYVQQQSGQCTLPQQFLLFGDVNAIKLLGLDSSDRDVYSIVQGGGYFSNFVGVTYLADSNTVYFSDVDRKAIFSFQLDRLHMSTVYEHDGVIDALAINDGRLYWSDSDNGQIRSMELAGQNLTQAVRSNLDKPRGLCFEQTGGGGGGSVTIYWTEWGDSPGLKLNNRANSVLSSLQWPNGCTVKGGFIYVGDGYTSNIYKCTVGTLPARVQCTSLANLTRQAEHIYDVAVHDNILFWSDWKRGTISYSHLTEPFSGDLVQGLVRPTQMYLRYSVTNEDCTAGHGCRDRCMSVLGDNQCFCNQGRYLDSDGKTCVASDVTWIRADTCDSTCSNNRVCAQQVGTATIRCVCDAGYGGDQCQPCSGSQFKTVIGDQVCLSCSGGASTNNGRSCTCPSSGLWDPVLGQCIGSSDQKSGMCPSQKGVQISCGGLEDCTNDAGCPGARKCCSVDGCSSKCFNPDVTSRCVYNDSVYYVGDVFMPNLCTRCVCTTDHLAGDERYGGAVCSVQDCPDLPCDADDQVASTGSCCAQCRASPTSPPTTVKPDMVYIICPPDQTYPFMASRGKLAAPNPTLSNRQPLSSDRLSSSSALTDLSVGQHQVTFTYSHQDGEQSQCQFSITIEAEPDESGQCDQPRADNGMYTCDKDSCDLNCIDGYVPSSSDIIQIICTNGDWSPDVRNPGGLCSKLSQRVVRAALIARLPVCREGIILEHTQESARKGIADRIAQGGRDREGIIFFVKVRGCRNYLRSRRAVEDDNLVVDVTLEAEYTTEEDGNELKNEMSGILDEIQTDIRNGLLETRTAGNEAQAVDPAVVTVVDSSVEVGACAEGSVPSSQYDGCVTCTTGTKQVGDTCQLCPAGTFQNNSASTDCYACPDGTKSDAGSFKSEHCEEIPVGGGDDKTVIIAVCAAIGGAILIGVVVVVVCFFVRKNNRKNKEPKAENTIDNPTFSGVYDDIGPIAEAYSNGGYETAMKTEPMSENHYEGLN